MQTIRIIRTSSLTTSVTGFCEIFIPNSVYTQCIRWKKKPIWLPTVKSKMFRVPKRPVISDEEAQEIQRLYNNYRTYMTSLRSYLRKIREENEVQFDEEVLKQTEEEDFHMCNVINNKWNAEVAEEREATLAKMRQEREEQILQKLIRQEERKKIERETTNEEVRKIKEELSLVITAENIDATIEECLTNVINHNRALDLEGDWYDKKYRPVSRIEDIWQKPAVIEQQI